MSDQDVAGGYVRYLRALLETIDLMEIQRVVETLRSARARGASVYVIGNGGSASTASHMATDLGKLPERDGTKPLRVMSMTDNASWITALANDEGFEQAFAGQLKKIVVFGDIVVAISASGDSPNVLRAVELARDRGATTIGLVGFDGGALKSLVDILVHIRSVPGRYGPVEDAHLALNHIITECLAQQ